MPQPLATSNLALARRLEPTGTGLHGPVDEVDLDLLESRFRRERRPVPLAVCPFADPALFSLLDSRGYRLREFQSMLVRQIHSGELSGPLSHPFEIQANDRDDFVARLAGVECAWGSMTIRDGVAECHGDLTAIPARNRGAQRALIAARISAAASRGCDLAAAVVTPGSVAQRNYECAGLQLAYNRALMQLDLDPPEVPGPSVERQLSRILGSRAFRNCERLRKFLSFTVRRALEGCGHELKEYSIGIDVFNRGSEFDPRTDPIVRVHAGRLRGRVHDYYREEGSGDPVAIEFRKGSYIPAFEWRSKLNRSVRVTNDTVLRELLST